MAKLHLWKNEYCNAIDRTQLSPARSQLSGTIYGAHEKHCILTREERSRLTTIEEEDKDLGGEEDEQVT